MFRYGTSSFALVLSAISSSVWSQVDSRIPFTPEEADAVVRIEDIRFRGFEAAPHSSARVGLDAMLEGGLDYAVGMPWQVLKSDWVDRYANGDLEQIFAEFGFLPGASIRPNDDELLPVGMNSYERRGVEVVGFNCFTCHAGAVAGSAYAGLANNHLDIIKMRRDIDRLVGLTESSLAGLYARSSLGERSWSLIQDFGAYMDTMVKLPNGDDPVVGRRQPFLGWRVAARLKDPIRKREFAGEVTDLEEAIANLGPIPPVDPLPWWLWSVEGRKRRFWTADLSPAATTFMFIHLDQMSHQRESFAERLERTASYIDFVAQVKSPVYPYSVRQGLAAQGYRLFHGLEELEDGRPLRCSGCHGTYEELGNWSAYPNPTIASYPERGVIDVGTDLTYSRLLQRLGPLYRKLNQLEDELEESDRSQAPPRDGYVAPPLVGIWASAPYFHNGSVPTLEQVLDSSARYVAWNRCGDTLWEYDPVEVGIEACYFPLNIPEIRDEFFALEHETFDRLPTLVEWVTDNLKWYPNIKSGSLLLRSLYYTELAGHSNRGHTYGDRMTASERMAVLEYLKTL